MGVTTEDLCQLMHETYESAAIKHGWYMSTYNRISWASVPEENRAAMRDAIVLIERVLREDEQAKHGPEAMQSDLIQIMKELGISTHARSGSPHQAVQNEILPKIRKIMEYGPEAISSDLRQITEELGIRTHARSYSPHQMVQKEILPKIRNLKVTLVAVRDLLDETRKLL